MNRAEFFAVVREQKGCMTKVDIASAPSDLGGLTVLVRCGADRWLSILALVGERIETYEKTTGDYVRDVCVPAGKHSDEWKAMGYRCPWDEVRQWMPKT